MQDRAETLARIDRILAVVDPRDATQHALRRAAELGRRTGAVVTALAAVHEDMPNLPLDLDAAALARVRERILSHYRHWLGRERRRLPRRGRGVRIEVVWDKRVAEAVIRESAGFDLVVKAAHRKRSWRHTPTDWQLIRGCRVPLWLAAASPWRHGADVLAAVDLGTRVLDKARLNDALIDVAGRVAQITGGTLHVAYAPPLSRLLRDLGLARADRLRAGGEELARRCAGALAARGGPPAEFHVRPGPPDKVLVSLAARYRCGLVVVGSIGRRALAGAVVGNMAERILPMLGTDLLVLGP